VFFSSLIREDEVDVGGGGGMVDLRDFLLMMCFVVVGK